MGNSGGRIEPGEKVGDTAVREIQEETGLIVEITRLIGVYSDPEEGRILSYPEAVVHGIDIFLGVAVLGGRLTVSSESEALQFFFLHALPHDMMPSSRALIDDVMQGTSGAVR